MTAEQPQPVRPSRLRRIVSAMGDGNVVWLVMLAWFVIVSLAWAGTVLYDPLAVLLPAFVRVYGWSSAALAALLVALLALVALRVAYWMGKEAGVHAASSAVGALAVLERLRSGAPHVMASLPAGTWPTAVGPWPPGGIETTAIYREGTNTASSYHADLDRICRPVFHWPLHPGSLNLFTSAPYATPTPRRALVSGESWLVWPLVLNDAVGGVAARREQPPFDPTFIEVFSSLAIRDTLGLKPGDRVLVRILDGHHITLAA